MKRPQSFARAVALAVVVAVLALAVRAPSLAEAQPLTYQDETETAGSSVQEQMPPATERPKAARRKPAKPKPANALRPGAAQPSASAADSVTPNTCAGRTDVLGTSRSLTIGAPNGLEVGLKTYPQTLKLADHEVVLTFDDGPLPATTSKILDALRDQCVRATFFLIGRNAEANPQVVRRQIREQHTVAHHTWSHPSITLRGLSDAAARLEISKGIAADERAAYGDAATPATPHVPFFRFPGFADTKPLLSWLGPQKIAVFGADLWASDWLEMTPEAELELVMSRLDAVGRGIILFHDTRPSTAAMMPAFLRELKARHYRVVHVEPGPTEPELEHAPPNWTSETEATVGRVMSKLLSRAKLETARHKAGANPKPAAASPAEPPQEPPE